MNPKDRQAKAQRHKKEIPMPPPAYKKPTPEEYLRGAERLWGKVFGYNRFRALDIEDVDEAQQLPARHCHP